VTSIDVREPTLEEIFLEYYGGASAGAAKAGEKAGRKPRRMGFRLPGKKGDAKDARPQAEQDSEPAGETA